VFTGATPLNPWIGLGDRTEKREQTPGARGKKTKTGIRGGAGKRAFLSAKEANDSSLRVKEPEGLYGERVLPISIGIVPRKQKVVGKIDVVYSRSCWRSETEGGGASLKGRGAASEEKAGLTKLPRLKKKALPKRGTQGSLRSAGYYGGKRRQRTGRQGQWRAKKDQRSGDSTYTTCAADTGGGKEGQIGQLSLSYTRQRLPGVNLRARQGLRGGA